MCNPRRSSWSLAFRSQAKKPRSALSLLISLANVDTSMFTTIGEHQQIVKQNDGEAGGRRLASRFVALRPLSTFLKKCGRAIFKAHQNFDSRRRLSTLSRSGGLSTVGGSAIHEYLRV